MGEEFHRRARDIAQALGEGWAFVPETSYHAHTGSIAGPKGGSLHLVHGGWRNEGRISIEGQLSDEYKPYRAPDFKITVSDAKPADTIARDIKRRILDKGYWEVLAETQERQRNAEEADRRKRELTDALSKILGAREFKHSPNFMRLGDVSKSQVWGDAEVRGNDVKFELHIPVEQAQRFASMIAALQRESVTVHAHDGA